MDTLQQMSTIENAESLGFYQRIRQEHILVQEIVYEYHRKNNTIITRVVGVNTLSLTDSYIEDMAGEFAKLRQEIIVPLISMCKHNFELKIKVDAKGHVNLDDIQIIFKMECKRNCPIAEKFRLPFKVLIPFSEYIDYVSLRGRDYELSVVEAEVNVNKFDLLGVIEEPLYGPAATALWYSFMVEAAEEAKKEFKLDVLVPVHEGEVTWNIQHSRKIQLREVFEGL